MSVYLNNAATTWPKPRCVAESMSAFLTGGGANLGRGTSSARDMNTLNTVMDCRIRVAEFFGRSDPTAVTFCTNITEALNIVLKGFLKPGMTVLTSAMEHNAVIRPLRRLEAEGVKVFIMPSAEDGVLSPDTVSSFLTDKKPDLVVLCHASNVCGTVQDLKSIAERCRAARVPMVLDSAQTAGVLPINAAELGLAALCFTGHKGLLGPQGIGGIVWDPAFAVKVTPFVEGGTGSFSHLETQPTEMPDKFESGTLNLPGIAGLHASLAWLAEQGIAKVAARESELGARMLAGLLDIESAIVYGKREMSGRLPVFAVNFRAGAELVDNGLLAGRLSELGFDTRPGLHCAPVAHRTLGSFPFGSLRVSPGFFNTEEEIDAFLTSLKAELKKI